MNYRYEKMFAYIYEKKNNEKQLKINIENKFGFSLNCGYYPYSNTLDEYSLIFGVSGTLECLHYN